jgi:hypothetical protein
MTVLLDFASFLCTTTNNSLWWAGLLNCVDFVSPAQPRRPILFSKQQMLLRNFFLRGKSAGRNKQDGSYSMYPRQRSEIQ